MTTTMAALSAANIRHAEFVKLTVGKSPTTTYAFCNAASPITVGGTTFTNLGSLLMIGEVQQEVKATSTDLTLSLTGIDPANIGMILSNNIKGSLVEVWRGFLDSNNQIITSPTTQYFKRYTGIINSVSINETFDDQKRMRIATCSIACCSMRKVLEARIAGLKTNQASWQFFYPGDKSMDRVSVISNTYFDFGRAPQKGGVSTDSTAGATDTQLQAESPGGGGGF